MSEPLRIFIGWDPREAEAYDVCAHSIRRHASVPVEITPIIRADLIKAGVYRREPDPLASTEFTYTRFFTPMLADFRGWALYCDCDFLFLDDVDKLFEYMRVRAAVMCVKHTHCAQSEARLKMDGVRQSSYPRKNWSSLMLFNCDHPSTRRLTTHVVNSAAPSWLHQMKWAGDGEIFPLYEEWNWLAGISPTTLYGNRFCVSAIHYTRGGPWFEACRDVEFADRWLEERDLMRAAKAA